MNTLTQHKDLYRNIWIHIAFDDGDDVQVSAPLADFFLFGHGDLEDVDSYYFQSVRIPRCAHFLWAWGLNMQVFVIGLAIAPGAPFRAFVRGRHSRNLSRQGEFREALLQPPRQHRSIHQHAAPQPPPTTGAFHQEGFERNDRPVGDLPNARDGRRHLNGHLSILRHHRELPSDALCWNTVGRPAASAAG